MKRLLLLVLLLGPMVGCASMPLYTVQAYNKWADEQVRRGIQYDPDLAEDQKVQMNAAQDRWMKDSEK